MRWRRSRPWRAIAGALLALTAVVLPATSAAAENPVELTSDGYVDTVGAISGREAELQSSLNRLYNDTGVQLFVVYVANFDGVPADGSWATETADLNGLGNDDILLAVATEGRTYDIRYPGDFRLDEAATSEVENEFLPYFSDDDWAGGAIAAANGYREGISGPGFPWAFVLGVVVVGGVTIGVVLLVGRRRASKRRAADRLDLTKLDQRASGALVQLDDSLKSSEQELGFAVAQFGTESAAPFLAALESAKAKVDESFRIKQSLDDAIPESDDDKRAALTRILGLCEEADDELDRQADAFDELRALEKTAPEALAAVTAATATTGARVAATESTVASLGERYSPAAIATVRDNPSQASKLLGFADSTAAEARAAIAAGKMGLAAVRVRTAQASLAQADQLLQSVGTLAKSLADATERLDEVAADTRGDLAAAKALQREAPSAALATGIAAAEGSLATLASSAETSDPVSRLAHLTQANQELEKAFGATRDAQVQVERARVSLDGTLSTARSQIAAANDFITTRRGGVGETARTRLAEANRHLSQAVGLAGADPVAALAEAQHANGLAGAAISAAQSDVAGYQGSWGQSGAGSGDSGISEAVIGGIIGGLIGGRGGFGGGLGGLGGGRSRSGGSGGFGGFGGSSRSPSRSVSRSISRSVSRSSRGRF